MKKLLIAASVALLALSFQASAAPVNMLQLSIEDPVDALQMGTIGSPFASAIVANHDFVSGSGKVVNNVAFTQDWGLELGVNNPRGIAGSVSFAQDAGGGVSSVQLYTDTSFTTLLPDAVSKFRNGDSNWIFRGVLTDVDHTYGLRIAGMGGTARGSYSVNTNVVPIPGAVWLFGSGMLGLLGLSRHKAKASTLSV